MRIVKLSESEFATLVRVRRFFFQELPARTPAGKFRVPAGHIKQGRLAIGEQLLFQYQACVVFTARSRCELMANDDKQRNKYPKCFVLDPNTLRPANKDIHEVERRYKQLTRKRLNLASQGWNILKDSIHTKKIWNWLRRVENFTLPDSRRRQKIEDAAIAKTTAYYSNLGYVVDNVDAYNLGWDLTVHAPGQPALKVEVKGLSGPECRIDLTPNEYEKLKQHRKSYRVCVVTKALTRPELAIFAYSRESRRWKDQHGRILQFKDAVAARCWAK